MYVCMWGGGTKPGDINSSYVTHCAFYNPKLHCVGPKCSQGLAEIIEIPPGKVTELYDNWSVLSFTDGMVEDEVKLHRLTCETEWCMPHCKGIIDFAALCFASDV